MHPNTQAFVNVNSPWEKKYKDKLGVRWATFKTALNLFSQRKTQTIVETGCMSQEDWGAGCSTKLFVEHINKTDGRLHTVDNSPEHIEKCRKLTDGYEKHINYHTMCSLDFFGNERPQTISTYGVDLLYLDSFDYPYGRMLEEYGGKTDIEQARTIMCGLSEEEIVKRHRDIISPCQEHCLEELKAAWNYLNPGAIVLIDDNDLPGGGKPRLAKKYLADSGIFLCVLDAYQTLWLRSG